MSELIIKYKFFDTKDFLIKQSLLMILIIGSFLQISTNSEDRLYLHKYSKLYNSPKFESSRPENTFTNINSHNCLQENMINISYEKIKHCGDNLIDKKTFEDKLKINPNYFNDLTKLNEICLLGYTTLPGSYLVCNYPMKRKYIAALLECFGLGFGHLYVKNYLLFFAKLLIFIFFCYMIVCVIFFVGAINDSNVSKETSISSMKIVKIIFPLLYSTYIIDIIFFSAGFWNDENKVDLY